MRDASSPDDPRGCARPCREERTLSAEAGHAPDRLYSRLLSQSCTEEGHPGTPRRARKISRWKLLSAGTSASRHPPSPHNPGYKFHYVVVYGSGRLLCLRGRGFRRRLARVNESSTRSPRRTRRGEFRPLECLLTPSTYLFMRAGRGEYVNAVYWRSRASVGPFELARVARY